MVKFDSWDETSPCNPSRLSWQTGTYIVLLCPSRIKNNPHASLLLNFLSDSIHSLCLIFILQTKACQVRCRSRHSHVLITFINNLSKEKNGFVTPVFSKQNELLCSKAEVLKLSFHPAASCPLEPLLTWV